MVVQYKLMIQQSYFYILSLIYFITIIIMSAVKAKLASILQSKASITTHKFVYRQSPYRQKITQADKHSTPPKKTDMNDYVSTRQKIEYKRRNLTENSQYNRRSVATIQAKNRLNYQRQSSFTNSKSVNLRNGKYLLNQEESRKDSELMLLRQQKLGRIKELYNLQNRLVGNKKTVPSILNSNNKLNSFKQLNHKFPSTVDNKSKQKILFPNNNAQGEKKQQKLKLSERNQPKFFDFCQDHSKTQSHQTPSLKNSMPQILTAKATKVKSMKMLAESPPLLPITFKKSLVLQQFDPQWVKKTYQPHLQIFQQISMETFKMKRISEGFYFGQFNANSEQRQGKGFIFYQNGKIFQGIFLNNQKEGLGYEHYPDNSHYMGNFHEGKRSGKGRFQWNNGELYEGEWEKNKKEGSGIWKGPQGLSYVGEWHNDIIQGFGVLVEKDTRYQGQFKNFMKWGNGTIRFLNGETYTGMFKQNLANGTGDYYWINGDHYHGQFSNGKRHGLGYLKYANGGIYRGSFQNDKKSGNGEQIYEQRIFYRGQFQNDLRHGWGILYSDNKIEYQGFWLNNSSVNEKKEKNDTIIQQELSIYEKDTSKNSKKNIQSNITLLRNKILQKKQQKFRQQRNRSKDQTGELSAEKKPFRRACNCQRHRLKYQMLD